MTFLQKIRILFSSNQSPVRSPLSPTMTQWLDELDYRDTFNSPRSGISIQELHAALTSAMEQGHGARRISIELGYAQGQLCGSFRTDVAGVRVDEEVSSRHDAYLVLTPSRTLSHLQKSGFRELMRLEEAQGPYS